jgi:RNA polymerase sigma factor (TIGR02999 family)
MTSPLTSLLQRLESGDRHAIDEVIPLVYGELKKLARGHLRREVKAVSLETTALVHEAFLRLAKGRHPSYENRAHFYGIASRLMRQVLVDSARSRAAEKRGPGLEIQLADLRDWPSGPNRPLLALDDALRALEKFDERKAQLIEMRYFGRMTAEETAAALSESVHVIRRQLRLAEAWLRKEMTAENSAARSTSAEAVAEDGSD